MSVHVASSINTDQTTTSSQTSNRAETIPKTLEATNATGTSQSEDQPAKDDEPTQVKTHASTTVKLGPIVISSASMTGNKTGVTTTTTGSAKHILNTTSTDLNVSDPRTTNLPKQNYESVQAGLTLRSHSIDKDEQSKSVPESAVDQTQEKVNLALAMTGNTMERNISPQRAQLNESSHAYSQEKPAPAETIRTPEQGEPLKSARDTRNGTDVFKLPPPRVQAKLEKIGQQQENPVERASDNQPEPVTEAHTERGRPLTKIASLSKTGTRAASSSAVRQRQDSQPILRSPIMTRSSKKARSLSRARSKATSKQNTVSDSRTTPTLISSYLKPDERGRNVQKEKQKNPK